MIGGSVRRVLFPLLALLSAVIAAAIAQDANPFNGTWRASFETKKGTGREGKVVISGQTGTWDLALQAGSNPCVGRAFPLAVQRATNEELVVEIQRSKALAGCKDGQATFRRVDDKTLQGEFDGGRKITLMKE